MMIMNLLKNEQKLVIKIFFYKKSIGSRDDEAIKNTETRNDDEAIKSTETRIDDEAIKSTETRKHYM